MVILFSVFSLGLFAQEYKVDVDQIYRPPVRKVLNMFSFTLSTGYNHTTYKHSLSGFYLLQNDASQFLALKEGTILTDEIQVYSDWFNQPTARGVIEVEDRYDVPYAPLDAPVLNPLLKDELVIYDTDSLGLQYKGVGWGVPLNLGLRFNYKGFRIGGGLNVEFHRMRELKPSVEGLGIRNYTPNFKGAILFSYYGQVGYKFLDFWDYSFAGEVEFGKNKMGKHFDAGSISQGIYVNLGVSIEKNLSEYFRVIVKPSFDFKSYNMAVAGSGSSIQHKNNAFKINFGVSITIPEIPRSPMKSDHIQLKHVLLDAKTQRYYEVRGQPFWKVQNPKVGQNYRKLWKEKFRNKRKLNPY